MEEHVPTLPSSGSLFPIANRAVLEVSASEEPLGWLSNPSFSESLLPAFTPISEWEVGGQKRPEEHLSAENVNELLATSSEEFNEDDGQRRAADKSEKRKRKKKKKEKGRRDDRKKDKKEKREKEQEADDREIGALEGMQLKRKSGGSRLVDTRTKDYYFDTHGDRDNLAFGSLYRMDVARFYRHQSGFRTRKQGDGLHIIFPSVHLEEEDATIDEKMRSEGRYWSPKYASLERRKDFRRLQIITHSQKTKGRKAVSIPSGGFIAVDDSENQQKEDGIHILNEESWDDYIIRKTREFNQSTRERPHDESLWIAFANFQDELVKETSRKAVIQQALDKKIAVLEKALEFHPFSEDVLLLFLDTCKKRDPAPTLISKWENVIKQNSESYRLWREYLRFRQAEFSLFTVSSLRKLYSHALQVLSSARNGKDEVRKRVGIVKVDEVEEEKNLISLFVDLCRFEWQTGHHELAVGLFQAQIEYSIFHPPITVNERNKKRLFKEFWDSGSPRVGEDGAAGWASWIQKEEERIQKMVNRNQVDNDSDDNEEAVSGGWTGWSEPVPKCVMSEDEVLPLVGMNLETDDGNEDVENKDDDQNEAALLQRLGLSLHSEHEMEFKDTSTWKRWSEEEHRRDSVQWMPIPTNNLKTVDEEVLPEAEDEDEQLERAVLFEDIRECLFSLNTGEARFELICQLIDFCDGPFTQWCCSNSMKWKERMEALENLFGPLLEEVQNASLYVGSLQRDDILQRLVGGIEWMHESDGRAKFVCNILLLCRPLFLHSFWFQGKLLAIVGHQKDANEPAKSYASGSRALAKRLLRTERQAVLLWGAYARVEAAAGNLDVARKIFDTTLASLSSLPEGVQVYAPILYLAYAEVELFEPSSSAKSEKGSSQQRVLHLLSYLGSGRPYTSVGSDSLVSSTELLKAKRGFKEQLQNARKIRCQGDLSDELTALIACAALFELLADGYQAAASVFEESLAMTLPGKQQQSLQFELICTRYIDMLELQKQSLKPKVLRHAIEQALTQYPNNPHLLGALIRCSSCSILTNDLRRFFDRVLQRNPSTVPWLFALSIEINRSGAGPRIHSLFERALEASDSQQCVVLWRCYLAYELQVTYNIEASRRVFFRAIHACPWSKALWLDGFQKMNRVLSAKELSELQDIMREKELRLRTDVYEILLEDEGDLS